MTNPWKRSAMLVAAALLPACAEMAMAQMDGMGATPGGVKDLKQARELIQNGRVPPPEAFVVEGLFAEHDLPLDGPACDSALCLRGALGAAPTLDGRASAWLQVGLSSNVNPATYQRPPLALVFCVDVSGSMGWGYSAGQTEYPRPGELSRNLLHALADRLDRNDRAALVTYGDRANRVLDAVEGTDPALKRAIDRLSEDGSTNMEEGLQLAYSVARGMRGAGRQVRVVLFTDAQPNVGSTSAESFEGLVARGAADGVGITVLGLGVGLGPELLKAMTHLRGANAFTLFLRSDVTQLMEESWPWMAVPIAYDLRVELRPGSGFSVGDRYGFPGGLEEQPKLEASTVFLSRNRGALLVRLERDDGGSDVSGLQVSGTLSHAPLEGPIRNQQFGLSFDASFAPDARGQHWQQHSVGRTTALAIVGAGMKQAATEYRTDPARALATATAAAERIAADALSLGDADLQDEVDLANALRKLIDERAPQGTLYGGGGD